MTEVEPWEQVELGAAQGDEQDRTDQIREQQNDSDSAMSERDDENHELWKYTVKDQVSEATL